MGCSGAGPSAADSRKDAENVAANGIDLDFFALDSVVRDNGWQEGDIYTVKHTLTYKMRAQSSLGKITRVLCCGGVMALSQPY